MRITNGIMNENAKNNITINKKYSDRLNTQVATGQKITRPSDDPVIAIRALRLNSNISELNQYYEKNIPDAESWLATTETALDQTNTVLENIRANLTTGASDDNTASDRMTILENLSALRQQIYNAGNADYAGRTVFTGFRTGESLTFMETSTHLRYQLTENFTFEDVSSFNYVSGDFEVNKAEILGSGYDPSAHKEQTISNTQVFRVRLAYDKLSYPQIDAEGNAYTPVINVTYKDGTDTITPTVRSIDENDKDKIYTEVGDDDVYLIPETGELILGKNVAKKLEADGVKFNIEYCKDSFERGDLRPEHYFACKSLDTSDANAKVISYNYSDKYEKTTDTSPQSGKTYYTRSGEEGSYVYKPFEGNSFASGTDYYVINGTEPDFQRQKITYEVAFNQQLEINTNACDVFTHDIGRDVDELIKVTKAVLDIEDKIGTLTSMKNESTVNDTDKKNIEVLLTAATKEFDYLKENMQKYFSEAITSFTAYSDQLNLENSAAGSKSQRLALTKERVSEQRQNFKELADSNINVDLTDVAIDLKSAQVALEAAQSATAKLVKQSLLNYI
ncbi:MAG: hypothetical protein K5931_04875 [Lachnospiraceae bacterium]|nr:hypothetical protein [Lachnospiraceae bacterium]